MEPDAGPSQSPAGNPQRWRAWLVLHGPSVAVCGIVAVLLLPLFVDVLRYAFTTDWALDDWAWRYTVQSPDALWHYLQGVDREVYRPTTIMVYGLVELLGGSPVVMGIVHMGLALLASGLFALLWRRLGFSWPAALLTAGLAFVSLPALACFTLHARVALTLGRLCLVAFLLVGIGRRGPPPARVWVPLFVLGAGSHELFSSAIPLLGLCLLVRGGWSAVKEALKTRTYLAMVGVWLAFYVGRALLVLTGTSDQSHGISVASVPSNLHVFARWLLETPPAHIPAIAWPVAALTLLVTSAQLRAAALRYALVSGAWILLALGPFLLAERYVSDYFLSVAVQGFWLLPVALCTFALTQRDRPWWMRLAPALLVVAFVPWDITTPPRPWQPEVRQNLEVLAGDLEPGYRGPVFVYLLEADDLPGQTEAFYAERGIKRYRATLEMGTGRVLSLAVTQPEVQPTAIVLPLADQAAVCARASDVVVGVYPRDRTDPAWHEEGARLVASRPAEARELRPRWLAQGEDDNVLAQITAEWGDREAATTVLAAARAACGFHLDGVGTCDRTIDLQRIVPDGATKGLGRAIVRVASALSSGCPDPRHLRERGPGH